VWITDSDTASAAFLTPEPTVGEASSPLTLTVELTINGAATLETASTVNVIDLFSGTATSGVDYQAVSATLTFPAGAANGLTRTVTFTPQQDTEIEGDETAGLRLQRVSGAVNAVSVGGTATVTIDDDDVPVRVAYVSDQDVAGDDELFLVNVVGGVASGAVQLNPALVAGGDVLAGPRTLGISADGRWLFYIADQNEDETFELFLVDLARTAPYTVTRVSADLTGTTRDVREAMLDPTGQRLIYLADQDTDGVDELYEVLLSAPGPGRRISGFLSAPSFVQDLQSVHVSPAGHVTYVVNDGNDDVELNLIQVTTGYPYVVRRLSATIGPGAGLNRLLSGRFTEGGARVVWVGEGNSIGIDECYLSGTFGGAPIRVNPPLPGGGTNVIGVAVSADGTKLAYWGNLSLTLVDVQADAVDLSGPLTPRRISPPRLHGGTSTVNRVVFNEAGTLAALSVDAEVDDRFESYVVDVTGLTAGAPTPLRTHPTLPANQSVETLGLPAFSPDGLSVLYTGDLGAVDDAVELYLPAVAAVPVAPSASRVSHAGTADRGVAVTTEGGNLVDPRFSSDGSLVFFRSDEGAADDDLQLYVRDLSQASTPQRVNRSLLVANDAGSPVPLAGRSQVVYVAAEAASTEEQLFLCTLVDPTDATSFTYTPLSPAVTAEIKAIKVWQP